MRRILSLFCVLLPFAGLAQNRADALQRAESYGARVANKVLNERLVFGWTPEDMEFWVREDLPGGERQFWLVTDKGQRVPAFDHAKVRAAMGGKLPFDRLSLSPDGKAWLVDARPARRIDRRTGAVSEAGDAEFKGLRAHSPADVRQSEGAGPRAEITFINNSAEPLIINWLDEGGERRQYKELEPGGRWSISTYQGHFWLVATKAGRALAVYKPEPGGIAYLDGKEVGAAPRQPRPDPAVSPDGTRRLRLEGGRAVIVEIATKKETVIGEDKRPGFGYRGPVVWAPDSKSVAFQLTEAVVERKLNIVRTTPRNQFQPRLESWDYAKPGDKLENPEVVVWNEKNGLTTVAKRLYPEVWGLDRFQWLGADRLTFRYNQRGHQVMRLVEHRVAETKSRTLFEETSKTFIDWTEKTNFHVLPGGQEAIWMSERSGWAHLLLIDLETGAVKRELTQGNWVVRTVDRVDEARREVWFRGSGQVPGDDPTNLNFYRVSLDGGPVVPLTAGPGNHQLTISPGGKFAVDRASAPGMPPQYTLRNVRTGAAIGKPFVADASELLKSGFRYPEVFVAKGRDGQTDIWGHIYRPTNFDPAKSYPVVEDIYAGPHSNHVNKEFHVNSGSQQIAELGFIVVSVDGMGTDNRGKAFHDVCYQNIADAGFPDRIAWMRAVAAKVPQMDLARVGIFGTSAGGQNTLHALLLHGDFYKVGVADCGCYDNRMDKIWWNEQWMGYPIGPHYEAQSCTTLAPKLQGKLMLLLGENDTNVDPASTWQVVDALVRANKDFDLIVLPNVGHGAISHPYARRRMREFLMTHLGVN